MNAQFLVDIAISIVLIATFIFFIFKFDRFAVNHGPEILTTLGIFGCFLGVVLALWELKPDDIITSMPALIGGIKTAFISSLMGVAGAIMLRTMQRFRKVKQPINRDEAKSNSIEDVVESLAALREGLVGSEQGTLLTQLKLLRQEQKDHSEEFIKEFKNFATHTSPKWSDGVSEKDAYFRNMKLSQERTRSTLEYVLQNPIADSNINWMRQVVTANGLSSSRPVYLSNQPTVIDDLASQRVEFRIVTNSEERLSKIAETMAISKK